MWDNPGSVTEIQAPPDPAICSRLRKVLARLASTALADQDAVDDLGLAFGEAFSNAVKYGSDGVVTLRVQAGPDSGLALEMIYPGTAFNTKISLPQDTSSGNGGFGRYIMACLTDYLEYSFHNGSTTLRMAKR